MMRNDEDDRKVPKKVTYNGLNSNKYFSKDGNLVKIS